MPSWRRPAMCGACLAVAVTALVACAGGGHRAAARARPSATGGVVATPTVPANSGSIPAATAVSGPPSTRARPVPPAQAAAAPVVVPAQTLVATIGPGGAPGSPAPGAPPDRHVPGSWLGAASVLPVIGQQTGWIEVRLAQRPNGSTAWLPATDVSLATDSYYVVVDLATTRLRLFEAGQEVANFPVGIGVPAAPTPAGQFFVALFARAPSPAYGNFVIVTSGHSDAISDWEASGDAITAIHGSLGADYAIGTTGGRVSHGCIRLHNADLAKLRNVPAGTPVDVVA
jgi:lipoprotein-anchoring transpeptidase ErfK/SrfK